MNFNINQSVDEVEDEVALTLTTINPRINKAIVAFSYKDMEFRSHVNPSSLVVLYSQRGCLTSKRMVDKLAESLDDTSTSVSDSRLTPGSPTSKSLINQFNFCERASLTRTGACKDKMAQTDPPTLCRFSTNASQWEIFDSYQVDAKKKEREKDPSNRLSPTPEKPTIPKNQLVSDQGVIFSIDTSNLRHLARVAERMISHNLQQEITLDFKFWEDPSDEYRDPKGSLLPLWEFHSPFENDAAVTAICWNIQYKDLFAAAFASNEISSQTEGYVCLFSLKCPAAPEKIYQTSLGVYSLSFHPYKGHLLVVGSECGSVSVFNVKLDRQTPICCSEEKNETRHCGTVHQVEWLKDDVNGNQKIASLSEDGVVIIWEVTKRKMSPTKITTLKIRDHWIEGFNSVKVELIDCGSALAFHKNDPNEYLVGTESGAIHGGSAFYAEKVYRSYEPHHGRVNKLEWNPFHEDAFISGGSDGAVCIWNRRVAQPLFYFFVGTDVSDVTWAPYSSTMFGVLTRDGKLRIFDISVDIYKPLCCQAVLPKERYATRLRFNAVDPIIIVSDNGGQIISVKVSPNLRKSLMEGKRPSSSNIMEQEKCRIAKYFDKASAVGNKIEITC